MFLRRVIFARVIFISSGCGICSGRVRVFVRFFISRGVGSMGVWRRGGREDGRRFIVWFIMAAVVRGFRGFFEEFR